MGDATSHKKSNGLFLPSPRSRVRRRALHTARAPATVSHPPGNARATRSPTRLLPPCSRATLPAVGPRSCRAPACCGGGATRRRPGAGRKQQRQDGVGRRRVLWGLTSTAQSPTFTWNVRRQRCQARGPHGPGRGDEDDDEEKFARPVEAPKVPKAAPTKSYVTRRTKYIKAAV